jgi:hypothetical protein
LIARNRRLQWQRNPRSSRWYQQRLAIARENIDAQENSLGITHDRFAKGRASELDVDQAFAVLATTRADVPTLESSIQTSMHRVEVLLGQQPGSLQTELGPTAAIPPKPPLVRVGVPSDLLLRRPDNTGPPMHYVSEGRTFRKNFERTRVHRTPVIVNPRIYGKFRMSPGIYRGFRGDQVHPLTYH